VLWVDGTYKRRQLTYRFPIWVGPEVVVFADDLRKDLDQERVVLGVLSVELNIQDSKGGEWWKFSCVCAWITSFRVIALNAFALIHQPVPNCAVDESNEPMRQSMDDWNAESTLLAFERSTGGEADWAVRPNVRR
jgi:hypothetical protein